MAINKQVLFIIQYTYSNNIYLCWATSPRVTYQFILIVLLYIYIQSYYQKKVLLYNTQTIFFRFLCFDFFFLPKKLSPINNNNYYNQWRSLPLVFHLDTHEEIQKSSRCDGGFRCISLYAMVDEPGIVKLCSKLLQIPGSVHCTEAFTFY